MPLLVWLYSRIWLVVVHLESIYGGCSGSWAPAPTIPRTEMDVCKQPLCCVVPLVTLPGFALSSNLMASSGNLVATKLWMRGRNVDG